MKLFGVSIDFNKNYTQAELDDIQRRLDEGFDRFCGRMFKLMFIIIGLAVVVRVYLTVVGH